MSVVPAWKRLGLKLKGPSTDGSPVSNPSQTTTSSAPPAPRPTYRPQQPDFHGRGPHGSYDNGTPFNKRKSQFSASYSASDNKRPRREDSDFTPSKRVSFTQDTKKPGPKKPKKKKAPKPHKPHEPFDFTPAVEYLRTWHKARDSWKFNKNHQTLLIKYFYDGNVIPASDIGKFYEYISDLKGAQRHRLADQAKDIVKKDMEAGPKVFPEGTKAPENKQTHYEEILAELMKRKAAIKEGASVNGNGKRTFDEVEFVLRTVDKEVQQRVVKRMRAESIVDVLDSSDSGESTDASTMVTTKASPSRIVVPVTNGADITNGAPKPKTARRKKLRTGGSDSSSSDSDSDSSDSDSDSEDSAAASRDGSSSSSSSDSDTDDEMDTGRDLPDAGDSSSDSSSSESGSGSESDDAAVASEDDSGSDGDSESSDDENA